jgi:hypothetical protein
LQLTNAAKAFVDLILPLLIFGLGLSSAFLFRFRASLAVGIQRCSNALTLDG